MSTTFIHPPEAAGQLQPMRSPQFYGMQQAARMLNIKNFGRTKLMALLREHQILGSNNFPEYQYVLDGHFDFYHKAIRGRGMRIACVPLISDSGIELVKNLIKTKND